MQLHENYYSQLRNDLTPIER